MNRILHNALSLMMAAETEQSTATSEQPAAAAATPVQTTEVRPNAQTPVNPHTEDPNTPSNRGKLRANNILAAEQGIVAAELGLQQTRVDGLIEIALIEREEDRVAWFSGLDIAFMQAGENGKKQKKHMTYTSEIRRVWDVSKKYREDKEQGETSIKSLVAMLQGKGTYAEKIQKLPRLSNAGGTNRGQGQSTVRAEASQAIQTHGQPAADALSAAAKLISEKGPDALKALLEKGPEAQTTPVTDSNKPGAGATLMRDGKPVGGVKAEPTEGEQQAPAVTEEAKPTVTGQIAADRAIVEAIMNAPESSLESLTICLSTRLSRSENAEFRDIGETMKDMLGLTNDEGEQPAAKAA